MGIWLVFFARTATVMFGALISRVFDPFALLSDFRVSYIGVVVLTFLCGILGASAGMALMANQRAARRLALVRTFFSVSQIPLGTTLGIYTPIVLLRETDRFQTINTSKGPVQTLR
jgi:hypothetical protein